MSMYSHREISAAEVIVARELARQDLYDFSRWMHLAQRGYPWLKNWHHEEMCKALERVERGECKRIIINLPPRYSKTELAVVMFIAWCLGRNPDCEFIHASYSATLAGNNAYRSRELVQAEEYRKIFPGVVLKDDSKAKSDWRTTSGGVVYAAGAGGTITGYGAGKMRPGFGGAIIIDDAHKPDEATSEKIREGVIEWFQNTIESRKNSPDTPIIVIMQRLHEDDLAGWLLKGGNGEKWEHVCFPAIMPDETALWPAKHSIETLNAMRQAAPYVFSGQYMQTPSPLGGGLIRGEWFNRYRELPAIQYRKIFVDTAQKTAERHDYSVLSCWGLGYDKNLYLLDVLRGKWEAYDLEQKTKDFWEKHNHGQCGVLRSMGVEDKSSGTGLIQTIKKKTGIPIYGIPREKDKLTRLLNVQGYIQAGRVWLPESAPWVSDFVSESEAITSNDAHDHDDQVDTMIDAITEMLGPIINLDLWARLAG